MNIAVAGTGYVGLSLAVLLAQRNSVQAVDIISAKVDLINQKKSPIVDKEIEEFLATKPLNLLATTDAESAYRDAEDHHYRHTYQLRCDAELFRYIFH